MSSTVGYQTSSVWPSVSAGSTSTRHWPPVASATRVARATRSGPVRYARAGVADGVESRAPLLSGERLEGFHRHALAEVIAEHGDVNVLGKPLDQTMSLRQRRAAFEEQARPPSRQAVVEHLQRPGDPEVLLDVAKRRAKPLRSVEEEIAPVATWRCDDLTVGVCGHRAASPGWVEEPRRSRRNSCIQIGSAAKSDWRSSRIAGPWSGWAGTRRRWSATRARSSGSASASCSQ